jgi:catechol 2,3-dioxygenase-like lactoylglutathione lyase family enzyme
MKRFAIVVGVFLAAGLAHTQPASDPATGPAPASALVGLNNFFGPIVANLEETVAFYQEGIGFEVESEPADADANPQLHQMFGLRDARLRWQIGRAPRIRGGVGVIEISSAAGEPLGRRIQDPGAFLLIVVVRDIDGTFTRLQQLGTPVVTRGGKPLDTYGGWRVVVVQDPAGHFVQLMQPPRLPATIHNVLDVRLRHTVADVQRSVALYRDALGLQVAIGATPVYGNDPTLIELLGLPQDRVWRYATLVVPTSGIEIELMEFKGARLLEPADIADPGATWMQLRVADVDAAVAGVAVAGGTLITTGGRALDLPSGNTTRKVGVVRDPDGLFLVLVETP